MVDRSKHSYDWFYNKVFGEESIRPRFYEDPKALPSALRAARSLESGMPAHAQSRSVLFVKQAKLLASYEDDYTHEGQVLRYFPTYQSLTDSELRGYFTWRTALRRGDLQKTHLTYAFLYIYELLNLAGPWTPEEAYGLLLEFKGDYGALEPAIHGYLNRWLSDFAVCYRLDPATIGQTPEIQFHNAVAVFSDIPGSTDEAILEALKVLAPGWLKRSKFYRENSSDMEAILVRVLRKTDAHYSTGKRPMVELFCGRRAVMPLRLFENAVVYLKQKNESFLYQPDNSRIFRCNHGVWYVEQNLRSDACLQKLEELVKTVDAMMRPLWGSKHPIQKPTELKWLNRIIESELREFLEARQAEEAARKAREDARIRFDFSRLDAIRRDAEITRDKLTVPEELEEEPEAAPEIPEEPASLLPPEAPLSEEAPGPDCPLPPAETRLLRCLLYGGSLDWIRQEGLMLSVLTDSINDILFEIFSDTVLTPEEPPELIEDYIGDLKEMVKP